jgi:uncharacterized protein involved in tolerance to divalent cations
MEYKVYPDNKTLCLTPENKLKEWADLIHKMASEGNIVKLYADTETTGFDHYNRGRATYDPVLEKKSLMRDSMAFGLKLEDLEAEAIELSGKVDRMIEIAFVACYTNPNGETYPLIDKDGQQVYFHEMIHPNTDGLLPDTKTITKMPLVPHQIHQTSFDFLEGNEAHPFLKIKLPRKAPSTTEVFTHLRDFFEYEDDSIYDNIIMLLHNGNDFDVPFINSEMNRVPEMEGLSIRDMVQTYDSLALIKELMPNPVQKLIAFAQVEEIYGGDPEIKKDSDIAIKTTSKSLDNLIKVARFMPSFDLPKILASHVTKQEDFAKLFRQASLSSGVKLWPALLEYMNNPSVKADLLEDMDKDFVKENKSLVDDYKKFKTALTAFDKHLDEVKSYGQIYNNLMNLQKNIEENADLKFNITCIKNMGRESHGAMVDSLLFMYAFTIIENSLYKNQKIVNNYTFNSDIKLNEETLEHIKKKSMNNSETTKQAVNKFVEKYEEQESAQKKDNRVKPKF